MEPNSAQPAVPDCRLWVSLALVAGPVGLLAGGPGSRRGRDAQTVAVLREHADRQHAERDAWGPAWIDTEVVSTRGDGQRLLPDYVFRAVRRHTRAAGLPPIRRLDLRHASASLAITAALYTHVSPVVAHDAADRIAALLKPIPASTEPASTGSPEAPGSANGSNWQRGTEIATAASAPEDKIAGHRGWAAWGSNPEPAD